MAKSSAESELYALVRASCEALGAHTLMDELGEEVKVRVHVDATAAKAIAERSGLDKLRHIDVNILWIQEQEARDRLPLVKVSGKINPADLMTKYVEGELIKSHMKTMNIGFREGRAQLAAQLYGLGQGGERRPKEGEETRGSEGKEERRRGERRRSRSRRTKARMR